MKLFDSVQLGFVSLKNRIVMAPMTRSRAPGNLPNRLMAEYYGQRAAAGLIVSEGTAPAADGLGYARIPGIFSAEQAQGWKGVAEAVHAAGGRIFIQLMHAGRVGSCRNLPPGARLLAPSALAVNGTIWTDSAGEVPYDPPEAMSAVEVGAAVAAYAAAAKLAIDAGCDGVELHGANGYLINQFLDPGSNRRIDAYGGNAAARNRFAVEVAVATAAAVGNGRVGFRISPYGVFNDMSGTYPEIVEQYVALAAELGALRLAYLHFVDHSSMGAPQPDPAAVNDIRRSFRLAGGEKIILSGGYDRPRAEADLQAGHADLIAFGRPFIANPDLPLRLEEGLPLATPDAATFYTPGAAGYTDYPAVSR